MREPKLKFWHLIVGYIVISGIALLNEHFLCETGAWPFIDDLLEQASIIAIILFIYIIIRNIIRAIKSQMDHQSLETSTYADEKEKELLRKQNEILVHLIQDEHRKEDR